MKTDVNTIGLLAHVDAGKTTLSEALLYMTRAIEKPGRVDHKDSLLDYNALERQRGITIYAKEARFEYHDKRFILEDTPGHIDFSMEMERVLPILDMAILLIDATSDIKAYTKRIFGFLKAYEIPTIIFANKSDLTYKDKDMIIKDIRRELTSDIIDFTNEEDKIIEDIATFDESYLEQYLKEGTLKDEVIKKAFERGEFYPFISGSALKHTNIQRLIDTIERFFIEKEYPDELKAYVYRISFDKKHQQLTSLKINGGILKVKDKILHDKVDEIRAYSGTNYRLLAKAKAGDLVTLKGPSNLLIGEYINDDKKDTKVMIPYLDRTIRATNTDDALLYKALLAHQKEDPLLNVRYENGEISLSLMGDMQMDILKSTLKEEGYDVLFGASKVTYKETITRSSYGIGHYEPLRHYAEVHLKLRPLKNGQGKVVLDPFNIKGNYIEVIKEYLLSKVIKGTLIGAEVTDLEISIIALKTSLAHTTNDDIKKACDFALRNALLDNEMVLLEPYEDFRLEPQESDLSNIIYLIEKMGGTYKVSGKTLSGNMTALNMQKLLVSDIIQRKNIYIEHSFSGFDSAKDKDEIAALKNYDAYNDPENMSGSIFFKNGAGYYVDLEATYELAHIKPLIDHKETTSFVYNRLKIDDEELKRVFERSNPKKKESYVSKRKTEDEKYKSKTVKKPQLYLVDGYNALYTLKKDPDLNGDVSRLLDELSYYQGTKGIKMWVVFDAYKVDNPSTSGEDFKVIYTGHDETADEYIQKKVRELKDDYSITVVTSDKLIQVAAFSFGAYRKSSRAIFDEIKRLKKENSYSTEKKKNTPLKELLKDYLDE